MKVGALFAGYGGLELGLAAVLPTRLAWVSEIYPAASKVLARHWPDVPNHGDITAIDWTSVEPVDVITGGSPCQDLSHAGRRVGMRAGTRSGLWASMCDAIDIIRPRLVIWENVRGALSAPADSDVEPCPVCVGDERDVHLRALGRVVGDLAELGYVGRWTGLRAADVGAPHGRWRVFLVAEPAENAHGAARGERRLAAPGQAQGGRTWADACGRGGAPAADASGAGAGRDGRAVPRQAGEGGRAALDVRPAGDARGDAPADAGRHARPQDDPDGPATGWGSGGASWGDYAPTIARWEAVTGRPPQPQPNPDAADHDCLPLWSNG